MELERKPHPGQIWQGIEGDTYRVLFCAGDKAVINDWRKFPKVTGLKHTETSSFLTAVFTFDQQIVLVNSSSRFIFEPHVVYRQHKQSILPFSRYELLQKWVCPLNIFLRFTRKGMYDVPVFTRIS